jgi:hypothetical protein
MDKSNTLSVKSYGVEGSRSVVTIDSEIYDDRKVCTHIADRLFFCEVRVGTEETVHGLSLTAGTDCVFVGCKDLLYVNSTVVGIP